MYARRLEVEKVAMDIVLLLTFGAGTQISIARVDYEREGAILSTRLLSLKREMRTFWRGPVWSHMTRQGIVKPYLENSYPNLTATALVFPMARLITILVDVRGESMVHTQGLLLANFLEIVRYNYARNVLCRQDKATQKGDRFRHVGQKNDWSFHEIWADFLKANGIGGWNASYKDFRNALSHGEELAGATLEEQHDLVLHILNFCDRIILALLQWDAVKGGYIPCHLPETTEHDENGVFTVKLNYVPFART